MPFVFVVLGLLFLVVAVRGTQTDFFALVKGEFWGRNSFVPWAAAILILGAIGYAKPVKPIADAMIGLILLAMILANKGGFFSQLNAGLNNPVAPSVAPAQAASGASATAAGNIAFNAANMPAGSPMLPYAGAAGNTVAEPPVTAPASGFWAGLGSLFLPSPAQ